jgi:hypothetical protein
MGILEKARANLPAKPVKTKKAASTSAVSKPVKDDYDEPEPPVKDLTAVSERVIVVTHTMSNFSAIS